MHLKKERKQVMDEEKKALVEGMLSGSEAAVDELYRSCSGKLYRMAYFITGNRSDSEDILQETFVKCFLYRASLKQPERFEPWLYQILVRTAWRLERRKKGRSEISFEGILENEDDTKRAERIQEDESKVSPLEVILEAETATEIQKALKRLDIKYRTVILLYYYNELSTREIAKITGTLEGTVKSRLYKARKLLKGILEADGIKEAEKERGVCHG
jgi:RNA polymerase sigma-70 factor (ECF subfamily)